MSMTIGFVTIAESPRDDVVPAMQEIFPSDIRVVERGNLNGLSASQIAALAPEPGEMGIVARRKAGGETLLSHQKILPRKVSPEEMFAQNTLDLE
jgi:protein AroM